MSTASSAEVLTVSIAVLTMPSQSVSLFFGCIVLLVYKSNVSCDMYSISHCPLQVAKILSDGQQQSGTSTPQHPFLRVP